MIESDLDKKYMREYMHDYRRGRRRREELASIREKIKEDRLRGDDIYTIGLRYGYNPSYVCRLCTDLPIKKYLNRKSSL